MDNLLLCLFLLVALAEASVVKREISAGGLNVSTVDLRTAETAYEQFWSKISSIMGSERQDFLGVLARNKGDLPKTISEFRGQLGDSYSFLQSTYQTFEPLWTTMRSTFNSTQNAGNWAQLQLKQLGSTTASKVYTWWDWISRKFTDMWGSIAPLFGSSAKSKPIATTVRP